MMLLPDLANSGLPTARGQMAVFGGGQGAGGAVSPLQPFYNSNTIGIHLRSNGATPPGGPVTAIANEGGAGALFNASVVGTPVPLTGNYLEATASSGYPQTANPADLIGVRLVWVMRTNVATGTYRFFGRSDGSTSSYVRTLSGTSLQLNSNVTGTSVTITTPSFTASAAARIFELEMTATEVRLWINGVYIGAVTHPWSMFRVDRLTQGPSTLQAFEGGMGDVMGVVTGQADTDAAISVARAYLNERFALGLTL